MFKIVTVCAAALIFPNAILVTSLLASPSPRNQFFDIDLLKHALEGKVGNVVVSPASVKSTLFMLMDGSFGDTRNELRRALRLSTEVSELEEQLDLYLAALKANVSSIVLDTANAVFFSDKLKPKKSFNDTLRIVYGSDLKVVNFSDPVNAADSVNTWVKNKTKGLIPELIEPLSISPTSSLLVLNAIYFKAGWKTAFNPQLTRPKCFYRNNKCVNVHTMQLFGEIKYAYVDELRAHAVQLPYEGGRYSLLVVVPHERDACEAVVQDLPHVSMHRVLELLQATEMQLSLPRFKVDYSDDLTAALKEIKISKLFSSTAELPGMVDGDSRGIRVDSVIQRVTLQVSELGTVAAAATGAVVIPLMGSPVVRLNVDRTFLFFVSDNVSGAILFEGKIEEPELA